MFAVLPVNVAGVLLIVLAVALFIAEAFTPTTGLLSAGGVLALFFGFFFLFDRADPVFRLSLKLIIPATIATAAFFLFIVAAGLRAQSRTSRVGPETMIGRNTAAVTAIDSHRGKVFVEGEYWNAVSQTPIEKGAEVEIIEMKGLTLRVRPMPAAPPSGPPTPTNPSNEEKL
jgi:membrane-bound serine protease (ClpP class)